MGHDIVICAEGQGKKYVIGHQTERESYPTLRDMIARNARGIGRTTMDMVRGRAIVPGDTLEEFWALKDVSFEVKRGEVVGIIGRNGAGKSTILKILSRITEPTEGRVMIKGRVASLLEVGTGFHPELTGRENIYLNGAILGMTRVEIRRKFDEIVAFAEVDRFLDTPVKRYSSGMYVRLAFAIAAHLEPEILIVDEVLAVGDIEFQKKCLGKMGDAAKTGRTVILVSHNMGAIDRLCDRVIFMQKGQIAFDGPAAEAIRRYQAASDLFAEWKRSDEHHANSDCTILRVSVQNSSGQVATVFRGDESIHLEISYIVHRRLDPCLVGARVMNAIGDYIFATEDVDGSEAPSMAREAGRYRAQFAIPRHLLYPGRYTFNVGAHSPHKKWYELIEQAATIDVVSSGSLAADSRQGIISPLIRWQTSKLGES